MQYFLEHVILDFIFSVNVENVADVVNVMTRHKLSVDQRIALYENDLLLLLLLLSSSSSSSSPSSSSSLIILSS